jgi:hypothetical protein
MTMPLNLSNLVAALNQFPRYHAIDVFADDLAELRDPARAGLRPLDPQGRRFGVTHGGADFILEVFEENGVARLSKTTGSSATSAGAGVALALVGVAIEAAGKRKGDGMLGGLLLGLLIGEPLGGHADDARRVFALAYDHGAEQWRPYDGGLLRWMKGQLALQAG